MTELFSWKKLLATLNVFDPVSWSKSLMVAVRLLLVGAVGFLWMKARRPPAPPQQVSIINPTAPIVFNQEAKRKFIVTGLWRDGAVGVTVGQEVRGAFSYGIGAEWDYDEDRARPIVTTSVRF